MFFIINNSLQIVLMERKKFLHGKNNLPSGFFFFFFVLLPAAIKFSQKNVFAGFSDVTPVCLAGKYTSPLQTFFCKEFECPH